MNPPKPEGAPIRDCTDCGQEIHAPAAIKRLKHGEPCGHPGCLSHISHPCEGCGRIAGRGESYQGTWKQPAATAGKASIGLQREWAEKFLFPNVHPSGYSVYMESRVKELTDKLAAADQGIGDAAEDLRADSAAVREALEKYGEHLAGCDYFIGEKEDVCSCGLGRVKAALASTPAQPYSPKGNFCSICRVEDQWCEHIKPPAAPAQRDAGSKVRELVAKWRKEGDESRGVGRRIHHQFADELEAALLAEGSK